MRRNDDVYFKAKLITALFFLRRVFEAVEWELLVILGHVVVLGKPVAAKDFKWSVESPECHERLKGYLFSFTSMSESL